MINKIIQLLSAVLLVLTSFHSQAEDLEIKKRIHDYTILSRNTDDKLPANQSRFIFIFKNNKGKVKANIKIGINDSTFTSRPSSGIVKSIVKSGKYKLYFFTKEHFEIKTDSIEIKSKEVIEIEITFENPDLNRIVVEEKPVIYIYSDTEKEMEIKLNVNGNLGFTWPIYNESWKFTATPEGKIKMDGKEFNYLFWESEMTEYALKKPAFYPSDKEGFLVATDTLLSFLENSLNKMGFTSSESADFITYWYPRMMKNEKNYIQFLFNDACDIYAQLQITPQPDHIFRVGMAWSDAENSDIILIPQNIPSVIREGITVIEWGGMEMEIVFEDEY